MQTSWSVQGDHAGVAVVRPIPQNTWKYLIWIDTTADGKYYQVNSWVIAPSSTTSFLQVGCPITIATYRDFENCGLTISKTGDRLNMEVTVGANGVFLHADNLYGPFPQPANGTPMLLGQQSAWSVTNGNGMAIILPIPGTNLFNLFVGTMDAASVATIAQGAYANGGKPPCYAQTPTPMPTVTP